jgi:non-specific serine/threonine protein kinase
MEWNAVSKLKQICNHPDQYLGQDVYDAKESGKFQMLRDICEIIYEKHERVLVFTQFKKIIPYLDDFLTEVFHNRRGFVLHGGTSVANRNRMLENVNRPSNRILENGQWEKVFGL